MNVSKKIVTTNPMQVSSMEICQVKDATLHLLENSALNPEMNAPSCPMKLHAFMVLASHETIWNRQIKQLQEFVEQKDKN